MRAGSAIIGDWGTSRLRLYGPGEGIARKLVEGPGIGQLSASPGATLIEALRELPADAPVVLGGMAGSRSGLLETPYADCPATLDDWVKTARIADTGGRPVLVAGGLAMRGEAADVMRGEEAQIFGALELESRLRTGRHFLLLPGTHSKHCTIEDGTIIHFRTHFTGELFALLTRSSTLLSLAAADAEASDPDGFEAGVAQGAQGNALAHLFAARARQLLDGKSPAWARDYLSGLLIGAELCSLKQGGGRMTLIGDRGLCERYAAAADRIGIAHETLPGEDCVIAGLSMLANSGIESTPHVD